MATRQTEWDAIVVGAGPAGSLAAYRLAAGGLRVQIFDQFAFPRYKPCGGGVPLHTLGEIPFDVKPVLEFSATGGAVTYRGRAQLNTSLDGDFAWLAMRPALDSFLLQKAIEAGVRARTGVRVNGIVEEEDQVRVLSQSGEFTAQYLVGADGVNSLTARALGLLPTRQSGIALEAEVAVPLKALALQGRFATFDFGALPHGYGWVFPKRDHLSVGVFQAEAGKAPNLRTDLERFMRLLPVLAEHEILHLQGHRIPLGGGEGPLHTRRCLLVGDAANLADSWLGEGIYYAARSATMAAEAVQNALANPAAGLASYTRRVHTEIRRDLNYAQRIARMVYRYPAFATHLISRSPAMQQDVFRSIRGDFSFRQLWSRFLWRFPLILVQSLLYNGGRPS